MFTDKLIKSVKTLVYQIVGFIQLWKLKDDAGRGDEYGRDGDKESAGWLRAVMTN